MRETRSSSGHAGARRTSILLVEDEGLFAQAVAQKLDSLGHRCSVAGSLAEARRLLADRMAGPGAWPGLVLLDERLPDGRGLDLLTERAESGRPLPPFIIMTAFGDVDHAISAMKLGAVDYLQKPVDLDQLTSVVARALGKARAAAREPVRARPSAAGDEAPRLLGNAPPLARARELVRRCATLDAPPPLPPVVITGETGTGKFLAARLLHDQGPARDKPFVHVDCATLPSELIESELFGHERGAFTGAGASRTGLIETAADGTLFLDEIGELPLELQAKLLVLLDRRRFRRVGGNREIETKARFVAATNRDLGELVAGSRFRADLFYRLSAMQVSMPALRDCREDIPELAAALAEETAAGLGRPAPGFTGEAMAALRRHDWPGNVRELKHVVARAVLLNRGFPITLDEIELHRIAPPAAAEAPAGPLPPLLPGAEPGQAVTLDEAERRLIVSALERAGGNVSKAARLLGVTRMTLRYRIEKHEIPVGR